MTLEEDAEKYWMPLNNGLHHIWGFNETINPDIEKSLVLEGVAIIEQFYTNLGMTRQELRENTMIDTWEKKLYTLSSRADLKPLIDSLKSFTWV